MTTFSRAKVHAPPDPNPHGYVTLCGLSMAQYASPRPHMANNGPKLSTDPLGPCTVDCGNCLRLMAEFNQAAAAGVL